MELVLSLERLNFAKLRALHDVGSKHNDAEMCDFIGAAPPRAWGELAGSKLNSYIHKHDHA